MTHVRGAEFLEILKRSGMIQEGHFLGKRSKKHFHTFINKDNLLSQPKEVSAACELLARDIAALDKKIDVVAGPTSGGSIVASWISFHLSSLVGETIPAVSIDRNRLGEYAVRTNYAPLLYGKRVLLVDDVVRSGNTLSECRSAVEARGARVELAAVLLDRGIEELTALPGTGASVVSGVHFPEVGFGDTDLPSWLRDIPLNRGGSKLVIGVTGRIGSGKSSFIQEALRQFPFAERFATGDILKETLTLWGLPRRRDLLVKLSSLLRRELGPDVIVDEMRRRIEESTSPLIFIDGVRGAKVYSLMREYPGSILVAITADAAVRYERVAHRAEKPDEALMTLEEFSNLEEKGFQHQMQELEEQADVCIANNVAEADFKARTQEFLSTLRVSD